MISITEQFNSNQFTDLHGRYIEVMVEHYLLFIFVLQK